MQRESRDANVRKIEYMIRHEKQIAEAVDDGLKRLLFPSIEREIRSLAVAGKVSPIATVPEVRSFVDKKLREFGKKRRIVMDGRDIGTTVFPDAELKIFMTASAEIRAERRAAEMRAKGDEVNIEEVKRNLLERDYIDSHRETSPLSKADDAITLDNSHMTMEDQMVWLKGIMAERFGC